MENVAIARLINTINGPNHFLTGSSVHNVRIERLWREIMRCVINKYKLFFKLLVKQHNFDAKNKASIWVLQYMILDCINQDLSEFILTWNAHPMSSVKGNLSPDALVEYALATTGSRYSPTRQLDNQLVENVIAGLEDTYEGRTVAEGHSPLNDAQAVEWKSKVVKIDLKDTQLNMLQKLGCAFSEINLLLI
jgi:hypothetical protein